MSVRNWFYNIFAQACGWLVSVFVLGSCCFKCWIEIFKVGLSLYTIRLTYKKFQSELIWKIWQWSPVTICMYNAKVTHNKFCLACGLANIGPYWMFPNLFRIALSMDTVQLFCLLLGYECRSHWLSIAFPTYVDIGCFWSYYLVYCMGLMEFVSGECSLILTKSYAHM